MTANEIIAIATFLGNSITDEQTAELMSHVKELSIADQEIILANITGPMYTDLTMYDGEMGGCQDTRR